MAIESNIGELQPWVNAYLQRLSPASRKKLLRKIGTDLAKENRKRMTAQQSPDGTAWKKRKSGNLREQVGESRIRFRYKHDAITRNVAMKSFREESNHYIGYDLFAGGIRRFKKDRIVGKVKENSKSTALSRKDAKMFVKIKQGKHLRTQVMENSISVGFSGRVGRIARIHHYGLTEQLTTRSIKHPERQLIGITDNDKSRITQSIIEHIEVAK